MLPLLDQFNDWCDPDGALFELAKVLGMIPAYEEFTDNKGIWCSHNQVNLFLWGILVSLENMGVLERNEDNQFRRVPTYDIIKDSEE